MQRQISILILSLSIMLSPLASAIGASSTAYADPIDTGTVTPYEAPFVDLYDNPDGALTGSTYIFNPNANFYERIAFDFKRMRERDHVNAVGFYDIVHMTDGDRNSLFDELEKNRQKAVIRIENYDAGTFDWDFNDPTHHDAINVINQYNTDDAAHGYTALLHYLVANDRLKDVAYFAVNMPVDDGTVANHFKNDTYADGRANPDWSTSQVAYVDDLISRLRGIVGSAKLYLSVFYGWDFVYNTPSYANIAHKADGYFLNNYSYPSGSPPDESALPSELINQPRLQQGMDRFMAQYPDDLKIIEYGFHTNEFNKGKPNNQTAGLVKTLAAKKLATKATTAFYQNGSSNGKLFNVRGTLYFAQNLYKEEGSPLTVSDWSLNYPYTGDMEAEDPLSAIQLMNGDVVDAVYADDSTASGGRYVDLDSEGKAVEFFDTNAGSILKMRYAASSPATLSLYVNGTFRQKINFPASATWTDTYAHIAVPLLGSIELKRDSGDGEIYLDTLRVLAHDEAEISTLTDGVPYIDTDASGGQGITLSPSEGSYLAYSAGEVSPGTQLLIRYTSEADTELGLYVNGKRVRTVSLEATGAMTGSDAYVSAMVPVSIPHNAVLQLKRDSAESGDVNIDYIQISGQYEAEFASGLYNGAHGQTNMAASGNGTATDLDVVGASAVFNGMQEGKQLKIRYSSTQNDSMTVYINGDGTRLNLPSTGSESQFKEAFINRPIPSDATVVIQRNDDNSAAGLQLDAISSLNWYEAESGALAGGTVLNSDPDASNGEQTVLSGTADSVSFDNVAEGSQLQLRYAAASDAQLCLLVNDRWIANVDLPSTGAATGSYLTTTVNADIPANAAVKFQLRQGSNPVSLDSISVILNNEAETANLIQGTALYADAAASGGMGADVQHDGDGISFANLKAGNKLLVRYAADGDGKLALYVNDVKKQDVVFPFIGTWKGQYNIRTIDADIPSGATVKLVYENGGGRVRIDNVNVTGVTEAEHFADKSADVQLQLDEDASSGAGMTGFGADGSYIAFLNKNGASSLSVRYKAAADFEFTVYAKYRDNVDDASIYKTDTLGVLKLPATGNVYRMAVLNAYIRDGMQIILKKETQNAVDASLVVDDIGFSDKMEAESAILSGGATAHDEGPGSSASNQMQVIGTDVQGASVTFEHVKAANRLIIGYTGENTGTTSQFSLYLAKPGQDFVFSQKVTFDPTGSWSGPFAERTLDVDIPYGSSIKLQNDGNGDTPVHFDYIKLTGVYEAENGNFYGNARTWYNAVTDPNGPSGNYWAWAFADIGDGVEIPQVRGGNVIKVRYSEGEKPGTDGQLGLFLNGNLLQDVVMPYTGSWGNYRIAEADVSVADGSVLKLQNTKQADHTAPIDEIEVRDKQREAENANRYGAAQITADAQAVYGYSVNALGTDGASVEFPGMNAGSKLAILYAGANDGTLSLYVNNMKKKTIEFPPTSGSDYGTLTIDAVIPQGATVKLQHDGDDTFADSSAIDSIEAEGSYAANRHYEAENGVLNGNAAAVTGNGLSDGWKVSLADEGDSVQFPEVSGGNAILLRYAAANGGTLNLDVNGLLLQSIPLASTEPGAFATQEVKLHVPKGASLTFSKSRGTGAIELDAIQISDRYEAEYAKMNGQSDDGYSPIAVDDAAASNGKAAARLWAPPNGTGSFEFPAVKDGTQLTIAYANGDTNTRKLTLYVNDIKVQDVEFPAYEGGGWDGKYNVISVPVRLHEGDIVKLQKDAGDSEVNLDYIQVDGDYEAEDAALFGSAYVSTDVSGNTANASRGLAVSSINTAGSGIEFVNVIAGNSVRIRYASQDTGTLYMYVNDGSKKKVVFPSTGSFTGTYNEISVSADVHAGDSVKFVFEQNPGEMPVSLDRIAIETNDDQAPINGMTVTSTSAGISLLVKYASSVAGQMSLYVNGTFSQKIIFPNTNGQDGVVEVKTQIPAGAEVKLQDDGAPDVAVNLVDMTVSDKYEAEYANLFGQDAEGHQTSAFNDSPAASNGEAVHFIWGDGSYLEFPGVIAGNKLIVGYSSGEDGRHLSFYVNGTKAADIPFVNTGGWTGQYKEATVHVDIPTGATVRIQRDSGDSDVIIDYIKITGGEGSTTDPVDTERPTAPQDLTISGKSARTVNLSWTASTDNVGVMSYDIYQDAVKIGSVQGTSFNARGLAPSTSYHFAVMANDAAGNISEAATAEIATNAVETGSDVRYEAEESVLFGVDGDGHRTSAFEDGSASNGEAVHFIWGDGSYLEFPSVIAGNKLIVGYSSGEDGRHLSFYVNGTKAVDIPFVNTGGWTGQYKEVTVSVDIPAGATVRIQRDPGDSDVVIDYIKVTGGKGGIIMDTEKPTAPVIHLSGKTTTSVMLSWTASTDNVAVTGYDVYLGNTKVGSTADTQYTVTQLHANTSYNFTVTAKDAAGNVSNPSQILTVSTKETVSNPPQTNPPADQQPPAVPMPTDGNIVVKPLGTDGKAKVEVVASTITAAFDQVTADAEGVKTIRMDIQALEGSSEYMLQLPIEPFAGGDAELPNRLDKRIEVTTPIGTIVIPNNMFTSNELKNHQSLQFSIRSADLTGLDAATASLLKGKPVIELHAAIDGNDVAWNNANAPVQVRLAYSPNAEERNNPEQIVVWYIDKEGGIHPITNGRYDTATGEVTFKTTHFSEFAVAYHPVAFRDTGKYTWANLQIQTMAAKGILSGKSDQEFSPNKEISRAGFLDGLIKALDLSVAFDSNFADVSVDNPYYHSLGIARKLGIARGTCSGSFIPNASITREEMAVLVIRAMTAAQRTFSAGSVAELTTFKDAARISKYAEADMASLVKSGIIIGSGGGLLDPKGKVTRAQTAVLLYKIYMNS
ncbi:S-layer homology domain-containing protein [Paenibacillus sp. CF384]|uniref:S-layer homology domain-containing protein n=1 Tax=Paenibacillus sp. CF384 TaxID=1884382 RepID=UPI00089C958C|nr:S-layer homology domain-containing protein [Paenibacillus sp. CF384]SDW47886.1 S-layer homology domain-containing protein [Paenibacillus sp. CF384]